MADHHDTTPPIDDADERPGEWEPTIPEPTEPEPSSEQAEQEQERQLETGEESPS